MYEAVKRSTPTAVRRFFHSACAQFLADHGGESGRVAFHWWEADDAQRALPYYLRAVEGALVQGTFAQARVWLERVQQHAPQGGVLQGEAQTWLARVESFSSEHL